MNRLIIIGNGFDLAHGLKTSYSHFINDYWKKTIQKLQNEVNKNVTTYLYTFETEDIKIEKNKVVKSQKYEEAAKLRDTEKNLLEELDQAKAAWEAETKTKIEKDYEKWELVSSHICRRSFATNLYGKLDNLTIMSITGHQTETQFLKYIRTTDTEKADKLKGFWDNEEADLKDYKLKII